MRLLSRFGRMAIGLQVAIIFATAIIAFAAANDVASSGADSIRNDVDPNAIAPPECAHINLQNIITRHSSTYRWQGRTVYVYRGGNSNDLIIGSNEYDDLFGNGGDDCLIAGNGIDYIWSGGGNDIINGGGGNDTCYSQGGNDTFISCQRRARAVTSSTSSNGDEEAETPPDPEQTGVRP